MKSPEQRKTDNLIALKQKGIESLESLPVIESGEVVKIRSKQEIVERALALVLIAVYAESLHDPSGTVEQKQTFISGLIDRFSAQNFFSELESDFLNNENPTQIEVVNFSWQYEPFIVLLWSLGFLSKEDALMLPPSFCDVSRGARIIQGFKNYEEFYNNSNLRDVEEILDEADLIYRYNWVCVQERISNPDNYESRWGIAQERHKALNWLINYGYDEPQDWDKVSTDT